MALNKSQIWLEIRAASSEINKAGGNAIELLLWSHGKQLWEVQRKIKFILEIQNLSKEEVKTKEGIEEKEVLKYRKEYKARAYVKYNGQEIEVESLEHEYMGEQQQRESWISDELRNVTMGSKKNLPKSEIF